MTTSDRDALETEIRRRCQAEDHAGAATAALRGYGPEIFGFLVAFHRSEQEASEVFSTFSERLWRGLPRFGWESSFRVWAYTIARNSSLNHRREVKRRAARQRPLPESAAISALVAEVRTGTRPYLQTANKDRFAELRASLSDEEQLLLTLRVDRGISYRDLARILRGEDERPPDDKTLERDAAKLRKRVQSIKERLVEQAKIHGLVPADE